MKEALKMRGYVKLRILQDGKLVREEGHNIIVDNALLQIVRLLANSNTTSCITQIGFGTSGATESHTDSSLTGTFKKDIDSYTLENDNKSVTFAYTLASSENNGMLIKEMGLICEDDSLFSRRVLDAPILKTVNIVIEGTWTVSMEHVVEA